MNRYLLLVLMMVVLSACGSYKNIPYYQDLDRTKTTEETVINFKPVTIQSADILGISVTSRTPESSNIFSYRINGNNNDVAPDNPLGGYMVNEKGDIQLPLLGAVNTTGLTTTNLAEKLKMQLADKFFKDPVVNVRIINFRITVNGDVQRPGIYTMQSERVTITQALALAGDLNITAKRTVILIREDNGKRQYIPVDFTSKKQVFDSPYYYLKNNDEIYVQPDRTKYATVDRGYRVTTLILSGLSIIAIVLSNIYR